MFQRCHCRDAFSQIADSFICNIVTIKWVSWYSSSIDLLAEAQGEMFQGSAGLKAFFQSKNSIVWDLATAIQKTMKSLSFELSN